MMRILVMVTWISKKKNRHSEILSLLHWFYVFIALFWMQQFANVLFKVSILDVSYS